MSLPGVNYLSVIKFIHEHLAPRTYLEIGVSTGHSLSLCGLETQVIGIDPEINTKFAGERRENFNLFSIASDDFFQHINPISVFNGRHIEMAFIDGLHLFEFALRDFINIERYCHNSSVILMHDTYPLDPISSFRKSVNRYYVGDTWKILPCLKKYRPDLEINTILTRPSGLTIISNLDPNNRVLADNLHEIYNEFILLDFTDFQKIQQAGTLSTLPIDPNQILMALGSAYSAPS